MPLKSNKLNRTEQSFMIFFIVVLSILSFLALIAGIISKVPTCLTYIPHLAFFKDVDFFTFAAVLVAAVAILHQSRKTALEKTSDDSRHYLDKYIRGCELILNRLKADTPTRRIAWVSAASIAKKAKNIGRKITEQPDKDFLAIYQRDLVHLMLAFTSEKPAIYYYGSNGAQSLNEAYQQSIKNQNTSVCSGLIPDIKAPLHIDENEILEIVSLVQPIWAMEGDVKCENKKQLLNWIRYNCPNLGKYLNHLSNNNKKQESSD